MPTVCFLGAGSFFTLPLAVDVMQVETLGGEFRLVDIDTARLSLSKAVVELVAGRLGGGRWSVSATTDRRSALRGAHYVINCIEVAGVETVRLDNDIPAKYGVSQCIGDTIGPGGLMKALRTGPVWLEVLCDCQELCPSAWVLNYTNPMSILCLLAARTAPLHVVGLCHSVQGSSRQLADYARVPYEELEWQCAGINHMAWFTKLRHGGRDLYPQLRQRVLESRELWERDPIRFDIMLHLGAFVTESSGHFSEYVPYYRKRRDLLEKYCRSGYLGQESFYADNWPRWRQECDERRRRILAGAEQLPVQRSTEYASYIIEARETNTSCVIHGNVPNRTGVPIEVSSGQAGVSAACRSGVEHCHRHSSFSLTGRGADAALIDNLPHDGIVEVACTVDASGIHPQPFGTLPPHLAALCRANMAFFELAATAVIERSREAAVQALMVDPLTAAVCCPAEIRQMAEELLAAQRAYIPTLS